MKSETFINVRKLAALDIVFHGPRLILAEFAFGLVLCAAFGLWSFFSPIHSAFMIVIGCFLLWVALNYVPLLLYAISIVRRKSAQQEVAFELAHKDAYARYLLLGRARCDYHGIGHLLQSRRGHRPGNPRQARPRPHRPAHSSQGHRATSGQRATS